MSPSIPVTNGAPPEADAAVPSAPAVAVRKSRAIPRVASPAPSAAAVTAISPGTVTPPLELALVTLTAGLQLSMALSLAAVNISPPTPTSVTPTLHLNGFDLVPSSAETVTSLYGRLSYTPGGMSLVQGEQQFDVVDSAGGGPVGTFGALVSKGLGYGYVELLVKSNDGINVGPGPGQVPPVGSVIAAFRIGRFGWSYSAMPSPSGNVLSLKLLTPFGDIPVPVFFDAAKGIADRTVDDRPLRFANGYSIAPAEQAGETLTGTSGILPVFTTVQGHQKFSVYDPTGQPVGNFDGVFTTTWDVAGIATQAILVTGNDGTNVGTAPGQVPPVGSVYNIVYHGGDDNYFLYSSLPSPNGDVISIIQSKRGKYLNIVPTLLNASKSPPVQALSTPDGYSFVPTSEMRPVGVNGLPPREVQIQGYQQFDVVDSAGNRIGSVDADVTSQWDLFGIHSRVLLVTKVTGGIAGSGPGDVPPVGSVFNFVRPGKSGFGTAHAVVPVESGDKTSFKLLTPLGDIVFPARITKVVNRQQVSFFSPFG